LSHTSVSISPADYNSWHDARTELMSEAKAGLKARVEAELAVAADDAVLQSLRDKFAAEERAIEHEIGPSSPRLVSRPYDPRVVRARRRPQGPHLLDLARRHVQLPVQVGARALSGAPASGARGPACACASV